MNLPKKTQFNWLKFLIIIAIIILISLAFLGLINNQEKYLHAKKGVLTLPSSVFTEDNDYLLQGEWGVYQNAWVKPNRVYEARRDKEFLDDRSDLSLGKNELRTYELILYSYEAAPFALSLNTKGAFLVWANNHYINSEEKHFLAQIGQLVFLHEKQWQKQANGTYRMQIVIQMAGPSTARNAPHSMLIGNNKTIIARQKVDNMFFAFAISAYIILLTYSITSYLKRKKDLYLLLFALLCFVQLVKNILLYTWDFLYNMFNISNGIFHALYLAGLLITLGLLIFIIYYLFKPKAKHNFSFVYWILAILIILTLFSSNLLFQEIFFFMVIMIMTALYCHVLADSKNINFVQLGLVLSSIGFYVATLLFDILVDLGFITAGYLSLSLYAEIIGCVVLAILFNILINAHFAHSYEQVSQQSIYQAQSLDEARKEKKQMLLDISHDLRTPIAVSKGYISLIRDGTAAEANKVDNYLERIDNRIDFMSNLVDDFFETVRLEEDTRHIEKAEEDISALLRSVCQDMQIKAKARNLDFQYSIQPDLTSYINRLKIIRVLENLINNALKFTEAPGKIMVKGYKSENNIKISVTDTGKGIESKDLTLIFERFYQADSKKKDSSGLGLYICKKIIDGHNGKIWVESKPNIGSTFTIEIPIIQEEKP